MEHKIIRTKVNDNSWGRWCVSCHHKFEDGEDRHEWRMSLKTQNVYHAGGFWNTHCHKCFVQNLVYWQEELTKAFDELPNCLKELA